MLLFSFSFSFFHFLSGTPPQYALHSRASPPQYVQPPRQLNRRWLQRAVVPIQYHHHRNPPVHEVVVRTQTNDRPRKTLLLLRHCVCCPLYILYVQNLEIQEIFFVLLFM